MLSIGVTMTTKPREEPSSRTPAAWAAAFPWFCSRRMPPTAIGEFERVSQFDLVPRRVMTTVVNEDGTDQELGPVGEDLGQRRNHALDGILLVEAGERDVNGRSR